MSIVVVLVVLVAPATNVCAAPVEFAIFTVDEKAAVPVVPMSTVFAATWLPMVILPLAPAVRRIAVAPVPPWISVVLVPMSEPAVRAVVEPAVALAPRLIVWVKVLPATFPIAIVLLTVELPRVIPPVLFAVPKVYVAPAAPCTKRLVVFVVPPTVTPVAVLVPMLRAPVIESTNGVVKLVLARPVPEMRKLAV